MHGQGGLLEVAPHPDYKKNGWIYLAIADGTKKTIKGKKKPEVKALTAIVRGRIKDNRWVDTESIWKGPQDYYDGSGAHFGSRIVFDKQGYLYFIVGERGALMEVQDLANPKGKIFRLHDDGRVPTDNPKFDNPKALPGIYSYGHRNPQGMARDPRKRRHLQHRARPARRRRAEPDPTGPNYGWPVITWGMNYNGTPMGKTHQKEWSSPCISGFPPSPPADSTSTPVEIPKWKNDLFVGALKQEEIRRLRIRKGKVTQEEVVFKGLGRVRDVRNGPDGFSLRRPQQARQHSAARSRKVA